MRIAICDDEKTFCHSLKEKIIRILEEKGKNFQLECYESVADFWEAENVFDILFLDVQMADGNGIDLAKEYALCHKSCVFIFISAFPQFVFDVFSLEAVDYLCKPVVEKKLENALERAWERVEGTAEKKLFVQTVHWCKSIPFSTVLYCEVIDRKLYLHTEQEIVVYYGKIEELERQLDSRFFRCHRSYLVNLDYVATCKGGQIILQNKETVPISRLRQKEFMQAMLRYMKGKNDK